MENFVVNNSANTTKNNTNENIFENTIGSAKTNVFALPTFDLQRFEEDPGLTWSDASSNVATVYSSVGLTKAMGFNGIVTVNVVSDLTVGSTITVDATKTITFTAPGNLTADPDTTPMFELKDTEDSVKFSGTKINSVALADGNNVYVSGNSNSGITSITGMDEEKESAIYTTYKNDGTSDTAYTIKNIGSNKFTVFVDKDSTASDVTLQYTANSTVNSATNVIALASSDPSSFASTVAVVATEGAPDSIAKVEALIKKASDAGYTVSTIDFGEGTINKTTTGAGNDAVTTYTVNLGTEATMETFTIDSATYINSATALSSL